MTRLRKRLENRKSFVRDLNVREWLIKIIFKYNRHLFKMEMRRHPNDPKTAGVQPKNPKQIMCLFLALY